jgi:hypothetical protein
MSSKVDVGDALLLLLVFIIFRFSLTLLLCSCWWWLLLLSTKIFRSINDISGDEVGIARILVQQRLHSKSF